jgi:hypothetical protein
MNWVLGFSCIDGFSFVATEPDIAKMFHRVLAERVPARRSVWTLQFEEGKGSLSITFVSSAVAAGVLDGQ